MLGRDWVGEGNC